MRCLIYEFKIWDMFNLSHSNLLYTISCYIGMGIVNSLSNGRLGGDFNYVYFKHNVGIDILIIQVDIALERMPEFLIDEKSTLVQVMAWCCQAASHYLNQCWPTSPTWYGVTRQELININNVTWRSVNSSPTNLADDILNCIFIMKSFVFRFEFHWSLFLRVQLTIDQHWFTWQRTGNITSHDLNQWGPSSPMHICGTGGRWVNKYFSIVVQIQWKFYLLSPTTSESDLHKIFNMTWHRYCFDLRKNL